MKFRFTINLMALFIVAAFAGFFFLKKPDGTPWLTLDDLKPEAPAPVLNLTTIYRWKENNQWSFSTEMPEHIPQEQVEKVEINPDQNLIQGLSPEMDSDNYLVSAESNTTAGPAADDSTPTGNLSNIPIPLTIQPDQLQQLFEDAKAIQQQMNQHNLNIQQYSGN